MLAPPPPELATRVCAGQFVVDVVGLLGCIRTDRRQAALVRQQRSRNLSGFSLLKNPQKNAHCVAAAV